MKYWSADRKQLCSAVDRVYSCKQEQDNVIQQNLHDSLGRRLMTKSGAVVICAFMDDDTSGVEIICTVHLKTTRRGFKEGFQFLSHDNRQRMSQNRLVSSFSCSILSFSCFFICHSLCKTFLSTKNFCPDS